VKDPAKCFFK